MADIKVDYQVFMSHVHSVAASETIGTDGIGTCVGVMARTTADKVVCGHLCCSVSGATSNMEKIKLKTKELMLQHVGGEGAVKNLFIVGNRTDSTTKWMLDAITNLYGKSKVEEKPGNGVHWDGAKFHAVGMADHIVGGAKGEKSDNGPFDVT